MRNRSGEKIKLSGIDELLGVVNEESAMEIDIASIHPFAGHPFKVIDDDKMQDLVESVRENGVITPVLIRPAMENQYEMISGHRRMHAAKLAGLSNIPAIVREMTDDEAVIAMVDANIQREELLPSEKAFAYKMKLSAMKRQAGRPGKNNSSQNGTNLRSDQVLAEEVGISRNQIQRYIRLTELIPELLNLVDDKKLQFTVAVEISYIDKEIQKWIYEYIRDNGFIKPIQITALRKQLETEKVSQNFMISIFNNAITPKKTNRKITLTEKKLTRYFPPEYSQEEMKRRRKNRIFLPFWNLSTPVRRGKRMKILKMRWTNCLRNWKQKIRSILPSDSTGNISWRQELYALRDFLISRLGSRLKHTACEKGVQENEQEKDYCPV